jgi:glutamine amidotransferase
VVAIIDYNVGNVENVLNACKRLGVDGKLTRDKNEILNADRIILPGVGAFPVAMKKLKEYDLVDVLKLAKENGKKIMGICLGMQILFEKGYEVEETEGLGFLRGYIDKIPTNQKLPHMGWNDVDGDDYYFVHSYMAFTDEDTKYAIYGDVKIPAIVKKDNVVGCQFHPEKSGQVGEKLLKKWLYEG